MHVEGRLAAGVGSSSDGWWAGPIGPNKMGERTDTELSGGQGSRGGDASKKFFTSFCPDAFLLDVILRM